MAKHSGLMYYYGCLRSIKTYIKAVDAITVILSGHLQTLAMTLESH
jgi:hypothetical protein